MYASVALLIAVEQHDLRLGPDCSHGRGGESADGIIGESNDSSQCYVAGADAATTASGHKSKVSSSRFCKVRRSASAGWGASYGYRPDEVLGRVLNYPSGSIS